jgi:cytochrome c biogenesis protein CcdA
MGTAIVQTVALGLVVAISPFRTTAVILVLLSDRARRTGPMFLIGFVAALAIASGIGLLLTSPIDVGTSEHAPTVVSIGLLVVGLVFLAIASWEWFNRPGKDEGPTLPRWLRSIDKLSPVLALGLGAGLAVFSFKNLGIMITAILIIAQANLTAAEDVVLYLVFVAIASLGVAIPVIWYLVSGQEAVATLDNWKTWLTRHNAAVMGVSMLLAGLLMIGKGIGGLVG